MAQDRRNYRKIYTRIWNSPEYRAMPDAGKVMTLYLLSGPQTNRVGLFKLSLAQAGEDLHKPVTQVRRLLETVCRAFDWLYDDDAQVFFVPTWWEYNHVENPKNLKGYLTDLNDMPRTALVTKFCESVEHIPIELRPLIAEWLDRLTPKPQPTQDRRSHHRSNTDGIGDGITDRTTSTSTSTSTKTKTETQTETQTVAARKEPAPNRAPAKPALAYYERAFQNRYGGKPEFAQGKDGRLMSDLVTRHGLEEIKRRIDDYFASADPFVARGGHTLGMFFSANTQTKLVAARAGPLLISDNGLQNQAAGLEAERRILERGDDDASKRHH